MTNNLPQIEKVVEVSEQLAIELGALMPVPILTYHTMEYIL
jgi:hypothetical protein